LVNNSDSVSKILEQMTQDPFAKSLGIELLEIAPGFSRAMMVLRPHMVNFMGVPHGGAIFTLADVALAAACNHLGGRAIALGVNIYYLSVASVGARLIAEATEVSAGKRTVLLQVTVNTEDGRPIAHAQGMGYIRGGATAPQRIEAAQVSKPPQSSAAADVDPAAVSRLALRYQSSALLLCACELDVFAHLASEPLTAQEVAQRCATQPEATRRLLDACAAFGLVEKAGFRYSNSSLADAFLVKGRPGFMGDLVAYAAGQYPLWARLRDVVRDSRPVAPQTAKAILEMGDEERRTFIMGLHGFALKPAELMADTLDLSRRARLLDVGGGPGTYSAFLAQKNPHLQAVVFDLAPVVEIAQEVIQSLNVEDQVKVHAGDYREDPLGTGYDVVLLSNILQIEKIETCMLLLNKAYDALVPGGLLLINGVMCNADGIKSKAQALSDCMFLLVYPEGRVYSSQEISGWVTGIGFQDVKVCPLGRTPMTLICAEKPCRSAPPMPKPC
jgi:phenylacetic acid degradation protein PaaD